MSNEFGSLANHPRVNLSLGSPIIHFLLPDRRYETLRYRYATAANMAANKTPSAVFLLPLLALASDSLVDAAVAVSSTFDTVTVAVLSCPP